MTQLMDLVHHSYRLKKEFDSLHDKMQKKIGFEYGYGVARMSIALSLSDSAPVEVDSALPGESGKTLKGPQLLGREKAGVIAALIIQHAGRELNETQFSNAVTAHWSRGLKMMDRMWEDAENDLETFIKNLLRKSGFGHGLEGVFYNADTVSLPQQSSSQDVSWPVDLLWANREMTLSLGG